MSKRTRTYRKGLEDVMDEYHFRDLTNSEEMAKLPFRMKEIALEALFEGNKMKKKRKKK